MVLLVPETLTSTLNFIFGGRISEVQSHQRLKVTVTRQNFQYTLPVWHSCSHCCHWRLQIGHDNCTFEYCCTVVAAATSPHTNIHTYISRFRLLDSKFFLCPHSWPIYSSSSLMVSVKTIISHLQIYTHEWAICNNSSSNSLLAKTIIKWNASLWRNNIQWKSSCYKTCEEQQQRDHRCHEGEDASHLVEWLSAVVWYFWKNLLLRPGRRNHTLDVKEA